MKCAPGLLAVLWLLWQPVCAAEVVVMGAEDDWYPYSGKIDGVSKGMAEDIVQAAFAAENVQTRFVALPYVRCTRMVKAGELVACFDTSRTALDEADFLWPQHPLFTSRALIYARFGSKQHNLGVPALVGKHVAVTNGYEYGTEFDSDGEIHKEITSQSIMGLRMLAMGRVDYAVTFEKVAKYLIQQHQAELGPQIEAVGLTAETSIYCVFSRVHPDSPRLLNLFNKGLAQIMANGQYQQITQRWH